MSNAIKCLFGYHTYAIADKDYPTILICENCKRFGYYTDFKGYEQWLIYDAQENLVYWKSSTGHEMWYTGHYWTRTKPKNWIYAK